MNETETREKRPRKNQEWRHRRTGDLVHVECRRLCNPMAAVRPHSDMRWSLVLWTRDGGFFGVAHEADFVADHEFVAAVPSSGGQPG